MADMLVEIKAIAATVATDRATSFDILDNLLPTPMHGSFNRTMLSNPTRHSHTGVGYLADKFLARLRSVASTRTFVSLIFAVGRPLEQENLSVDCICPVTEELYREVEPDQLIEVHGA